MSDFIEISRKDIDFDKELCKNKVNKEEKEMNNIQLKRGMRITFRYGDRYVIESIDDKRMYTIKAGVHMLPKSNLKSEYDKRYDIMRVEDLNGHGDYVEIYKRKEGPKKYYIMPKGIKLEEESVLCIFDDSSEDVIWDLCDKGHHSLRHEFTKSELEGLGLNLSHYDLIPVEGDE